jgi:hypothetical protein
MNAELAHDGCSVRLYRAFNLILLSRMAAVLGENQLDALMAAAVVREGGG